MIWATFWENLFMPYAINRDADPPAHPCSLISVVIICCLDSTIHAKSTISRLYLVSIAEQAGLSLTWSQTLEDRFSHDLAHIIIIALCSKWYEHNKTYKMTCAPSKCSSVQSDQWSGSLLSAWRSILSVATGREASKDWADVQADLSFCWVHAIINGNQLIDKSIMSYNQPNLLLLNL